MILDVPESVRPISPGRGDHALPRNRVVAEDLDDRVVHTSTAPPEMG
jgi:hypothetical protein